MAEVNEEGIPGGGIAGILHPALQHRWRFIVQSKNKDMVHALARNTVRVGVSYVTNTMDIEIEENIKGETSDVVYDLVKKGMFKCYVEALDGNTHVPFANEFSGCVVNDHSVSYDYALSGIVTHKLKIHFNIFNLLIPKEESAP